MSIKELPKIQNFENEEIKVSDPYGMLNMPKGCPNGFHSLLAVGASGSGKTNGVINLIKKMKNHYNRFIIISPTGCKDDRGIRAEKKWDNPKIEFDHEYDTYYRGLIRDIIDEQKECIVNYDEYIEYKKLYDDFLKWMRNNKSINNENLDQYPNFMDLLKHDFTPPDFCPYFFQKKPPSLLLIIDDMASTPIYTNSLGELVNLQMRCRHLRCSVWNLIQAYKLIPRSIRLNSHIMMLFPCKSPLMIKEIADTCSNNYSPEEFIQLFQYATKDKPYHFLYMDARTGEVRKNFNKPLSLNNIEKNINNNNDT